MIFSFGRGKQNSSKTHAGGNLDGTRAMISDSSFLVTCEPENKSLETH